MFTGIIEKLGTVLERDDRSGGLLRIRTGFSDLTHGESVAVNGVCLTVTETTPGEGDALFFVSPETFSRTQLGSLGVGSKVNLERALSASGTSESPLSARLSGHIVQGHVDGVGRIAAITPEAEGSFVMEFELPESCARYCVEKASIALNGVSLTINRLDPATRRLGITVIPHTWIHTQFHASAAGDPVNVEVDIIAKYVERLCRPYR